MKILVIGGTKQMGKYIVDYLIGKNEVVVANRGIHERNVEGIITEKIDINDESTIKKLKNNSYDIIIVTVAYNVKHIMHIYNNLTCNQLIVLSSVAVYPLLHKNTKEEEWDPVKDYSKIDGKTLGDYNYQYNKREVERLVVKLYPNYLILRIPHVWGTDCLSTTLSQIAKSVCRGEELLINEMQSTNQYSVCKTDEVGRFISYAIQNNIKGIYNICSEGTICDLELIQQFEQHSQRKAIIKYGIINECYHTNVPSHSLDLSKIKATGYQPYKLNDWLIETIIFYVKQHPIPRNCKDNKSIMPPLSNWIVKYMHLINNKGTLSSFFNNYGVPDYDVYLDSNLLEIMPNIIRAFNKEPKNYYTQISDINMVQNGLMVTCCHWDYDTYRAIHEKGYEIISFSELIDYALYDKVLFGDIHDKIIKINPTVIHVKIPKATLIRNKSPLEKYLSDNSIYSYSNGIKDYGVNIENIPLCRPVIKENSGVQKYEDKSIEGFNIINGFRHTTDNNPESPYKIWVFGNTTTFGIYVHDSETICSVIQKLINKHFGKKCKYNVVNVSNFNGNNIWEMVPLIDSLEIKSEDILVFNLDYPKYFLKDKEIVDANKIFERPHNNGELFIDINHLNNNGCYLVGEYIANIIIRKVEFMTSQNKRCAESL